MNDQVNLQHNPLKGVNSNDLTFKTHVYVQTVHFAKNTWKNVVWRKSELIFFWSACLIKHIFVLFLFCFAVKWNFHLKSFYVRMIWYEIIPTWRVDEMINETSFLFSNIMIVSVRQTRALRFSLINDMFDKV